MKRIVSFFAVATALALASTASAQVQTGSILVRAVDEQGAVMPGVTITISSPVLVARLDDRRHRRRRREPLPVAGAGHLHDQDRALRASSTVTRENIVVLVGQTTPVEFAMKVASLAENITVTGASPTVDTTSANVTVNLSEQLIQGTPGGRDIWALLEAKVPGLVMSRPDVGGTSGGLQGTFSARGTTSAQNTSFLNGVNVGDPAAIGAAGFYYDFDAFDDIQVSTGAHDITVPTSGVFLNMITKTRRQQMERQQRRSPGPSDSLQGAQRSPIRRCRSTASGPTATRRISSRTSTSPAGGPLVAEQAALLRHRSATGASTRTCRCRTRRSVLDQTNITSGLGNVTWQVNQNNRITGFYSRQRYSKPNRLLNSASITVLGIDQSTKKTCSTSARACGTRCSARTSSSTRALGVNKILFPTYFNGGNQQSITDNATGIIYGNNPEPGRSGTATATRSNATAQYYVDQALGGRHEFKFGFDYSHAVDHATRPRASTT